MEALADKLKVHKQGVRARTHRNIATFHTTIQVACDSLLLGCG